MVGFNSLNPRMQFAAENGGTKPSVNKSTSKPDNGGTTASKDKESTTATGSTKDKESTTAAKDTGSTTVNGSTSTPVNGSTTDSSKENTSTQAMGFSSPGQEALAAQAQGGMAANLPQMPPSNSAGSGNENFIIQGNNSTAQIGTGNTGGGVSVYTQTNTIPTNTIPSEVGDNLQDRDRDSDDDRKKDPYEVNIDGNDYMFVQDQNGDGKLDSKNEILGINDTEDNLFGGMKDLDSNKDGTVSVEEFESAGVSLARIGDNGQADLSQTSDLGSIDLSSWQENSNFNGEGVAGIFDYNVGDESYTGQSIFEDENKLNSYLNT